MNAKLAARAAATNDALIALLAETNAVWEPLRNESRRSSQWFFQREYRRCGGVPWGGKSTSTAEGQERRKLLAELEASGLVVVTRGGQGKATMVRLTDKGLERAREAAGIPSLAESLEFLRIAEALYARLRKRRYGSDRDCLGGHLVSEAELVKELGVGAVQVERLAAPALERGWLSSSSTIRSDVSYFITSVGQAQLAELEKGEGR